MLYTLEQETKSETSRTDSNEWLGRTTFHLIKDTDEEKERWAGYVADECGNQDYSYRVKFKTIGTFDEAELKKIAKIINKTLVVERLIK